MIDDEHNFRLAKSIEAVDQINSAFYGRFQYPQAPMAFYSSTDPSFEVLMLNQDVGSWDHSIIPPNPRIWIAGCGTNQAVYTGLRFPTATIIASDLSVASLATSQRVARQVGVNNVEFRHESINDAAYQESFDYVICTGVIHHNADPAVPLSRLASALKPAGILELMVYNRYHRILTTAFQKAIRLLVTGSNFESELQMARKMIGRTRINNWMTEFMKSQNEKSEAEFADALLQPVEYSFTIESVESLLAGCGLELLAPCINQFDKALGTFHWNSEFDDPEISALYYSLPDLDRWKISNYLMMEKSPMLWFYCQRQDSERPRSSEKELCRQFLELRFVPAKVNKKHYLRLDDGRYQLGSQVSPHPGIHPDPICRKIIDVVASQPEAAMGDILRQLGLRDEFTVTNGLRLCLTTGAFPYLISNQARQFASR